MDLKDFMWKQNRLSKDKEALKAQMMGVLKKGATNKEGGATQAGVAATAKKDSTQLGGAKGDAVARN
jgi:hypothetical protein